jgi:hypothetical protein
MGWRQGGGSSAATTCGTAAAMRVLENEGAKALRRRRAWELWWGCLGVFYRARRGTEAAGKAVEWMA